MKALDISPSLGGEKDFMNDYVTVTLNGFLLNAGVIGLIKMFDFARLQFDDAGCTEGVDYEIDGQSLHISRDFLLSRNLADLYVRSMVYYMGDDTKFSKVMNRKSQLDKLYEEVNTDDKGWVKKADEIFKEFVEMLSKASFKSGYEILSKYEDVTSPTSDMVTNLKKAGDYMLKKELYDELHLLLEQEKVKEVLIFKELMYSKINLFMEGVSFFEKSKSRNDITQCYRDSFVEPLIDELKTTKKKEKRCIDCGELASKTLSMSFLVDVTDDVNRKKSYYWNCNPDAFLCPLCNFVYSFAPLGFHYLAGDAVFVNNNSSIDLLNSWVSRLDDNEGDSEKNPWFKVYNVFTSEKTKDLHNRINNVQVVIRDNRFRKYILNNIDKNVVGILDDCKPHLDYIKSRYVKDGEDYINVYQEAVEHVVKRRSLYGLISRLIRISLKDGTDPDCAFSLVQIEIRSGGGEKMAEKNKRAYVATRFGKEMRQAMTVNVPDKDKDNKLRGLVYQLLNAASLGNRDEFIHLVLRTYSGCGRPVPDIFLGCFDSNESFKEIAFAYILGLKSDPRETEEDKKGANAQ